MITYINGKLIDINEDHIVLENNGIGYYILISQKSKNHLCPVGGDLQIFIETITRNDQEFMCGFINKTERDLFKILIGVQGVGAKVGLAIMSGLETNEIIHAIIHQNADSFKIAEGVGAKVASRIVLELKNNKIIQSMDNMKDNSYNTENVQMHSNTLNDAICVLQNLGYNLHEAKKAINAVRSNFTPNIDTQQIVRLCLQKIKNP